MLQLRPTFSESWYRVVTLKPRLRGTAQISRQYYRGERWYVVRDAASNQFHRLSDAAYRFVGLLDGTRTVGDAWDLVGGQLADDAPTQPEVIQILSQLYAANLVETDIPPDATVLLRRHKKQMSQRFQSRLMNVLFPRMRVWDPDRFLCRWMPLAKIAFSKLGAIVWLITVISAIVALTPHWADLRIAAADAVNISKNWENALYLWIVFVLIKFIHECGHAFSCRRFGGEVHEMGIMLLVFIPTPYVDASTAWAFPNRWARMFVGAAGMVVELFVAALCAFFWLYTKDSNSLATHLAYNTMLIASVSTVLFNANPLLRYDGYYILSDYLEIPNLQMRSREYLQGLIRRHIFRIKASQPLPPTGQRVLLLVYGICSTFYRILVGVTIILVVTWQVPIVGVLMGLGGVITWLVVPLVKLFKYLTIDPELHRKRGRAWAFTLFVATSAVMLVGVIHFPRYIYAEGVVEPLKMDVLHATSPGWVTSINAHDGDKLSAGDVIAVLDDPSLTSQHEQLLSQIDQVNIRMRQSRVRDLVQWGIDQEELDKCQEQLKDVDRKISELTIKAPFDGYLVSPDLRNLAGRYVERGTEVATVATTDMLLIRATVEQRDSAHAYLAMLDHTQIRLVSRPEVVLNVRTAENVKLLDAAQPDLPSARQSASNGGAIQTDPRDPKGTRPMVQQFEIQAEVPNGKGNYMPGQGAWIRLELPRQPLFNWARDRFMQLIDSRDSSSKWI